MRLSDVRLSLAIMAVPQRTSHVVAMVKRLEGQIARARRIGLEVGPVRVFWDSDRRGPWFCWRNAWALHELELSTHHAVIQDDVLLCADLPDTLCHMAAARPDDVVSCFLPRKSVSVAHEQGIRWVRARRFLWAQCVMMPCALGDAAIRWIDEREAENASAWGKHDDVRMAAYLTAHRRPVYVPVPHPVEHVGDAIGGSVMGHNGPAARRRARAWLGEDGRGAGIDWTALTFVRD